MGRIICITSQKGGTGKTTMAVNLAASFALFEKKTLLIDCDPQGNATTGLGIEKDKLEFNIYHALTNQVSPEKVIVDTELDLLKVLPARFELVNLKTPLSINPEKRTVLKDILQDIKDEYEYILIDSPASIGPLSYCAMIAADKLLIPLQCQLYALEGLGQLLVVINKIRKELNPGLKIAGFVLTMFEESLKACYQSVNETSNSVASHVFKTKIPFDTHLQHSANMRKPAILLDLMAEGSSSYMKLAVELLEMLDQSKQQTNLIQRGNYG